MESQDLSIISKQATLVDATRLVDEGARPVLVVHEGGRFAGLIDDDELRQAMVRGLAPNTTVAEIADATVPTLGPGADAEAIAAIFRSEAARFVLELDAAGRPRVLHGRPRDPLAERRPRHAVLMVGGEGTRLRPLTDTTPKPLLPVGGRPILERILEHLRNHEIRRVTMALGYRARQIEEHFAGCGDLGVEIDYVREEKALGTAGAIGLVPEIGSEPLLVMNGDILTDLDFAAMADFHRREGAAITVAVRPYQHRVPYGVTRLMGRRIVGLQEKPILTSWTNAGIYIMEPEIRSAIPASRYYDMTLLIEERIDEGDPVMAFPVREYWCDIGLPEDYQRANHAFADRDPR